MARVSKRGRKGEGRPKWEPSDEDIAEIGKLAAMQCTQEEIAAWFGVSPATVKRRIKEDPDLREVVDGGKLKGKISFRRLLWKHAELGNAKAIGLLASRFGFDEKVRHEVALTGAADKLRAKVQAMLERVDEARSDAEPDT